MDYFDKLLEGVCEIGWRMLAGGAEIYRIEDTVSRLLAAYGVKGEVFALPNCLIVSIADEDGHTHTRMRRLTAMPSTDIETVERFNALSRSVCAAPPPPGRLMGLAEETAAGCRQYSLGMALLGYFAGSFFFTFLFGGGAAEALIAGLAGAVAGLCVTGMNRLQVNFFFSTLLAAAALGLAVYTPWALGAPIDAGTAVIGALMTLVPGLVFTNFMCDLITGDALSGVSMFVRAVLSAAAMALGTGVVVWAFEALGFAAEGGPGSPSCGPVLQCAASFAACAGFALLYNAHGGLGIVLCALGGTLGWAVYLAAGQLTGSVYLRNFAAAVAITVYAQVMARVRKFPMTAYLVVSYFPLVPGGWIYYTMYYAITGQRELFLDAGVHTLGIAGCIAMGTLLVSTAVRTWYIQKNRRKR